MKLWEKNYLITFLSFAVILNMALFSLAAFIFHSDLKAAVKSACTEEQNVSYTIRNYLSMGIADYRLSTVFEAYRESGIEILLSTESRVIAATLETEVNAGTHREKVQLQESGDKQLLLVVDQISQGKNLFDLLFVKDLSHVYAVQTLRIWGFVLFSIVLTSLFGYVLYQVMKNLYRPVENIAHELRTPLTGIKGYAQYLMMAKLSEEDRYFATEQILSEANNLQNIVEKLLLMGNLRQGQLKLEWVALSDLFDALKPVYPGVSFPDTELCIKGDAVLLKSLLGNLISNGVREGTNVSAAVLTDGAIRIHNDGSVIGPSLLRAMNRNGTLPAEWVHGSGRGLPLCHEIVRIHGGKLIFSSNEGGTDVTVHLSGGAKNTNE